MLHAYSATAAAQTDTSLVVTPGAGRAIQVIAVTVSAIGDDTFTFEDEDNTGHLQLQLAAKSSHTASAPGADLFTLAANKALTYTSLGTGIAAVAVTYQEVDA